MPFGTCADNTGFAYPEYCGSCTSDGVCPVSASIAQQFKAQWDIHAPAYSKGVCPCIVAEVLIVVFPPGG